MAVVEANVGPHTDSKPCGFPVERMPSHHPITFQVARRSAQTSVKAATAKTAQIIGFSNLITVMVILQPGTYYRWGKSGDAFAKTKTT